MLLTGRIVILGSMTDSNTLPRLDREATWNFVDGIWESEIVPNLIEYIAIPNKSPLFDPDWAEHGYMEQAVTLIETWCRAQKIEGLKVEVVRLEGRTPLIYMEIPGEGDDTVLLYGHLDKQPEMTGWRDDLGPWKPVRKGERLYGRGGADDGYSAFASLTAIRALHEAGMKHARCVVLIEACEESGSYDLPFYIDHLSEQIGEPSLVVCLDSGCGDYERMWSTTSLRGMVVGNLRIDILNEGVHSGDASGIVPSSFRVLRSLLTRLEDVSSGQILPDELIVEIPEQRKEQAAAAAEILGDSIHTKFPFVDGATHMDGDLADLVLARTWKAALSVTGVDGIPSIDSAGNVLRPFTRMKLSLRIPPTLNANEANDFVKQLLEKDPPYGSRVHFDGEDGGQGWNAPALADWLGESVAAASSVFFGNPAAYMGEGGSIPFMGMLGTKFPKAQFLITGVLGPASNAHGPNEFLDIPTGKKLTCCVAQVLSDHLHRKA
ncbi:MAG: acetylornithine deacetylase/succinyl-diaminopimelate desuccinylase-like protein [Planctomycetota bacterium]|jgi:acetylornithine deacetylase/succinyl-diaminopimelate desuccinylase-like protein